MTDLREKLIEHLRAEFGDAYDCTRVWEAWSVGTMGEDDFEPVTDRLDGIADGILALLPPVAQPVAPAGDREAAEPVAYQLRRKGGDWERPIRGGATARAACFGVTDVEEVRALYTAPPAQPAEERAVVEAAMERWRGPAGAWDMITALDAALDAACTALSRARTGSEGVS